MDKPFFVVELEGGRACSMCVGSHLSDEKETHGDK